MTTYKNNIEINFSEKELYVTKTFLNKASKMGTKEYKELTDAVNAHPSFEIVIKQYSRKTYSSFTIASMKELIKTQPNADAMLAEFETVLKLGRILHEEYPRAKKWMFENYGDVIRNNTTSTETTNAIEQKAA